MLRKQAHVLIWGACFYSTDPVTLSCMKSRFNYDESQLSGESTHVKEFKLCFFPTRFLRFFKWDKEQAIPGHVLFQKGTGCLWTLTPGLEQNATVSEITVLMCHTETCANLWEGEKSSCFSEGMFPREIKYMHRTFPSENSFSVKNKHPSKSSHIFLKI